MCVFVVAVFTFMYAKNSENKFDNFWGMYNSLVAFEIYIL